MQALRNAHNGRVPARPVRFAPDRIWSNDRIWASSTGFEIHNHACLLRNGFNTGWFNTCVSRGDRSPLGEIARWRMDLSTQNEETTGTVAAVPADAVTAVRREEAALLK